MSERLKTASCCRRAAASHANLWRVTNNARMYVTTAMTSEPIALMLIEQPSLAATNRTQPVNTSGLMTYTGVLHVLKAELAFLLGDAYDRADAGFPVTRGAKSRGRASRKLRKAPRVPVGSGPAGWASENWRESLRPWTRASFRAPSES